MVCSICFPLRVATKEKTKLPNQTMNTPSCRQFLSILASGLFLFHSAINVSAGKIEPVTYDLNADWSDERNPNGAWSYNSGNDPISIHQTFWWGQAGWGLCAPFHEMKSGRRAQV